MMAHGYCYRWDAELVWLHVGSDALIALAYFTIAGSLVWVVGRLGRPLPFAWLAVGFASFILACGVTHVLAVWTVWHPDYWLSGFAKLATAAISVATAAALPTVAPRVVALLAAERDATRAREREERHRRGLLGGRLGDWQWDTADDQMQWSPVLQTLLAHAAGAPQTLEAFHARVHPEDRAAVEAALTHARRRVEEYALEFRVLWPDGSVRWLEARGQFWRRGRPGVADDVQLSGLFWDATARKVAESRYRIAERAIHDTSNGIAVADASQPDEPLTLVNPAFEQITGYAASEVLGRNCRFLSEDCREQEALDRVRVAVRDRGEIRETVLNRRKNGQWFWNDLSISPVWDDGQREVTHFVGVLRDVTDHVALAMRRDSDLAFESALRVEAQEANRAKDEFLALLSHELRTPLHAALTWLQIAEARPEASPEISRALTALRRALTSMARLVEELLDSSRIIAGKFTLDREPVRVTEAIESTTHALEALAAERGVSLVVDDAAEGALVEGDARRLAQALRALVDNAIKYSERGGRVVLSSVVEADGTLVVAVKDDGVGIAADLLPHLFERFHQADSSRSRSRGGLGLGLFLVRSIVEAHGGTVSAESAGPGRGAVFEIRLPVSAASRPAPPIRDAEPGVRKRLEGVSILLIEDDELAAEALEEILELHGADVHAVACAADAKDSFATRAYDLVVSDVGLPDEDGISLIGALREMEVALGRNRTPALAMSGYTSTSDVADMLAAGFDRHVPKPIEDFGEFQDLLVDLVRGGLR